MTGTGYRRKDIKRACDCCGHVWFMSDMKYVGQNRWFCPDDAPGLTAEQISRHNARVQPLIIKNARHPRPATFNSEYLFSEERVFRLVLDYATTAASVGPTGKVITSANPASAAWAAIYLASIVQAADRPGPWLDQAVAKLPVICAYLRSLQYGDASGPSPSEATTSILYGHVTNSATSVTTTNTALSGLAFLMAYQVTGDSTLLTSANLCGHALRNAQRADIAAATHHVTYAGGWPQAIVISTRSPSSSMVNDTAIAIWFFKELRNIVGGAAVYGSASAAGDFASAPAGTVDATIAEAVQFYFDGKMANASATTAAAAGQVVAPVSVATPAEAYSALMSDASGTGNFTMLALTTVTASPFCMALRSLYEHEGYSARVAAIFAWLMGFTVNPTNGAIGYEFDPEVAMTGSLQVKASSAIPSTPVQYATTQYAMGTAGLLAPLYIASGRTLRTCKDEMAKARKLDTGAERGLSSWWSNLSAVLTAQTPRTAPSDRKNLLSIMNGAPLAGLVYRYAPKAHAPVA